MNKVFYTIIFLLISISSFAQKYEIGVFLGGSNYIGDVGPTTYIAPHEPAFGLLFKWNRSTRFAYRFSYTQSKITARDKNSSEPSRNQRGYDFNNNISELFAGFEFNFFKFDLSKYGKKVTPYLSSGVGYFKYDQLYFLNNKAEKYDNGRGFSLPVILGVKTNLTQNIVLGLEAGVRYTKTDNIDGSNPLDNRYQNLKFGNTNNKDWYTFSGVTLTYIFGTEPCYCPGR